MADYWKSNPRKFCEVCRCWLADNKASIEFHEGGRRHQGNVQKQLREARTRSSQNAKEQLNIEKTLSAIEHAAFSAYQQDIAGGKVKKAKVPLVSTEAEQLLQVQEFLAGEQEKVEKELEKKKIEAHAKQKVEEIQSKALESAYKAYSSNYAWQQCYSSEGYPYFYNSVTGVTQWEVPVQFQAAAAAAMHPPPVDPTTTPIPTTATPTATSTQAGPLPTSTAAAADVSQPVKRSSEQASLEGSDSHQPPKRRDPYGGWTTVAVIEKEPVAEERLDDDDNKETEEENAEKEEFEFEEKKMTSLLEDEAEEERESGELKGGFKGFSFKKRLNKGRPQIKQRTSDW